MRINQFFIISTLILGLSACSASKNNTKEMDDDTMEKIMILLADDASPTDLSTNFKQYQLKEINKVSKHQNKWMYTFNANKVSRKQLIIELGNQDMVENIEKIKEMKPGEVEVSSGTSGKKGKVAPRKK